MMSPSENEDDAKKTRLPPVPLCLFCFPEDVPFSRGKTYVDTPKEEPPLRRNTKPEESFRKYPDAVRQREKEEFWLRKRTEARIRRRRMKEPIRNLRSYLLASVKCDKSAAKGDLPSLFEVLETVKDAWPSPSAARKSLLRNENQNPDQRTATNNQSKMKDEKSGVQFQSQLLNRRLSVPEELMRKYSVSKEKTSEESEPNKTTIEISPSSSSTIETARWKGTEEPKIERPNAKPPLKAEVTTSTRHQTETAEEAKPRKTDLPQRVTQSDYYKQGKRIIKVRANDRSTYTCTCGREPQSSSTVSAKEETDDSGTTESILSSPTQLPKRESSSGNLSSESDNIRCTCAELSSMETSADLYLSGKSTLSQTVSDKSMSTQDSTVSINSVSSRGSTATDNSNSTTPEVERTSAKETTTSPDYSPRTPRNRKNRRRDKNPPCPRHNDAKHPRNYLPLHDNHQCPVHSQNDPQESRKVANAATNTHPPEDSLPPKTDIIKAAEAETRHDGGTTDNRTSGANAPAVAEERYKWAKLSQEELYMMQQLRHRRFIESQRNLCGSLPPLADADSVIGCGTGSSYKETEQAEQAVMIPRYSALPRSLSMLVNTSSPETSHNSDSDNQSLADSLEDQPMTHIHRLYFDTKKESKPVRGDASAVQGSKQKHRQPRGRAFFVSIKQPYGEDEMLENIDKIPQPPERIKKQIFKRHLKLCAKHKHLHHPEEEKEKKNTAHMSKKTKTKNDDGERVSVGKRTAHEEGKKIERKLPSEKTKRKENDTAKLDATDAGNKKKDGKERSGSKIPVLVSSRSTSSSPDGEPETKEKSVRPKVRVRREKEAGPNPSETVETTQVLQIMHKGAELSLQKPQAVIHPSKVPLELKADPPLVIPPLVSTLRIPPLRQTWNKQLLAPVRRSPIGKFRQRFEVIPEEKSSSLSSAEEKNGKESATRFADVSTSPVPSDKIHFQSYSVSHVPNLIVAKITNQQLETLPAVNSADTQKIILFSSGAQNSNSSKGRDALIAMNREDFNRLAKGWMNFYKLNENLDNSETEARSRDNPEEKPETSKETTEKPSDKSKNDSADVLLSKEKKTQCRSVREPKNQKPPELDENIRFDSSNTILQTAKPIPTSDSSRTSQKQTSLPELKPSARRTCEVHKTTRSEEGKSQCASVGRHVEDDDTDSDSTDYMEPPSPRVPPLPIEDLPSDATLSSSDTEPDIPKPRITTQSLRHLQPKRRSTTSRSRLRKDNLSETTRCGKKKNSGWSVTVAGTVELSRSAPDLEMRLSFPASAGPPVVCQSDSGFAEESSYSKLSESLQELDLYTFRKEPPSGKGQQKWMVTVKNPKSGGAEESRKQFPNHHLPDLEPTQSRKPKKVLKNNAHAEDKMKRLVERKMRAIWPEVQRVIQREFLTESGRLTAELEDCLDEGSCLSVRGNAVSLEKKQKPPTMTERDVTRRYTSRAED